LVHAEFVGNRGGTDPQFLYSPIAKQAAGFLQTALACQETKSLGVSLGKTQYPTSIPFLKLDLPINIFPMADS